MTDRNLRQLVGQNQVGLGRKDKMKVLLAVDSINTIHISLWKLERVRAGCKLPGKLRKSTVLRQTIIQGKTLELVK